MVDSGAGNFIWCF